MDLPILVSQDFRLMAGDAALFLVVGGLFMLGFVLLLVLLRAAIPRKPREAASAATPPGRQLRYTPNFEGPEHPERPPPAPTMEDLEEGRKEAAHVDAYSLDHVLDKMVTSGWGEPRVLRWLESGALLRFYRCRECDDRRRSESIHGCGFAQGYLEVAMARLEKSRVLVRETACRRTGHGACEYEVRFAAPQ